MSEEIWADIEGYERMYQISNKGRAKSLERQVLHRNGGRRTIQERVLSLSNNADGYPQVGLYKNGILKTYRIHSLVARAFIGERPPKYDINHKDLHKDNNCVENLEYVTHSQNAQHAWDTGRDSRRRVLTAEMIFQYLSERASHKELAEVFEESEATIDRILHRYNWSK